MNSTTSSRTPRSRAGTARRVAATCGVGVLVIGAATACGSRSNDDGNAPSTSNSGPQTTQGNGGGQFPGANGKIAEVDGSTAQVQSLQNGQVAVTWNASTTFTKEVAAKLADVKVGDCVMATPDPTSNSASADDSSVAAATVRIISTRGDCTSRLGGQGGGQGPSFNGAPPNGAPSGVPSGVPSGAPSDFPSGAPNSRFRGAFGATGKVTAVSGSGFTVASVRPDLNGSGSSDDTTTTSVTVTTSSSTRYTSNAKATASDVKVGGCMVAQGTTDDTGAVTARTVALSAAVDGDCTGGFVRFRDGGPGGPGSDSGTGSGTAGQAS